MKEEPEVYNAQEALDIWSELVSPVERERLEKTPWARSLVSEILGRIVNLRKMYAAAPPAVAEGDDYIAWARDVYHGQYEDSGADIITIELCDSDAEGAFKVYRAAARQPTMGAKSPINILELQVAHDEDCWKLSTWLKTEDEADEAADRVKGYSTRPTTSEFPTGEEGPLDWGLAGKVISDWHDVERWRDPSMFPIPPFSGAQESALQCLIRDAIAAARQPTTPVDMDLRGAVTTEKDAEIENWRQQFNALEEDWMESERELDALKADVAEKARRAYSYERELLSEVLRCGIEIDDERMSYAVMQIDRALLKDIRALFIQSFTAASQEGGE